MIQKKLQRCADQLTSEGQIEIPWSVLFDLLREARRTRDACRWHIQCEGNKARVTLASSSQIRAER